MGCGYTCQEADRKKHDKKKKQKLTFGKHTHLSNLLEDFIHRFFTFELKLRIGKKS